MPARRKTTFFPGRRFDCYPISDGLTSAEQREAIRTEVRDRLHVARQWIAEARAFGRTTAEIREGITSTVYPRHYAISRVRDQMRIVMKWRALHSALAAQGLELREAA